MTQDRNASLFLLLKLTGNYHFISAQLELILSYEMRWKDFLWQ